MIFWIFFLILSLMVEVYLWWKLQASLIFLSGRTCTIVGWPSHHICIYIYSLVFLFHSFYCFYVIFILLSCFIFLSCTFHWADLSWLTFHYLLYPVWLCMWQIIKNLEPWTLTKYFFAPLYIVNFLPKIYQNLIWTTLKAIFSIFQFFCTLRFQIFK